MPTNFQCPECGVSFSFTLRPHGTVLTNCDLPEWRRNCRHAGAGGHHLPPQCPNVERLILQADRQRR